ncbi:KpsF/GutQ family sugar-phosphate isomerase [Vibrio sp. dsl-7]|uniref:Arabinose 5-phosphate isomerase n=1 Tax=Vibrio chanodichtyis TaxID=3027932 RepID=A0ABT5V190_9VIBR|nr:KpsF/GutQ family sugar-phosphate isomerase [Vibrio chanodichtyis]MDE1515427.1 KpsF/GutQ family sugar-phosphate isomerase [Vibrio chanodichtyis]
MTKKCCEMKVAHAIEMMRSTALRIVKEELAQANKIVDVIDSNFTDVCRAICECKGKIIVSGIGKSGHIGKKIAATFASTGTPSFFVHLAEALHGDLGMVESDDIIIFISNSGEAPEFKVMAPLLTRKMVETIAITQNLDSFLAKQCAYSLSTAVDKEACPLGLAPSASTVNTLILGDTLALTIMTMKGFSKHDFALSHPAGALGNKLLLTLDQLLSDKHQQAFCNADTKIADAVELMCNTGFGLIAILSDNKVSGVFTDGDLRRAIHRRYDLMLPIGNVMTTSFKCSYSDQLCSNILKYMNEKSITALPVIQRESGVFLGVINVNTIHQAGIL